MKIRTWTRHFPVLCASWHFYTLERNLLARMLFFCLFVCFILLVPFFFFLFRNNNNIQWALLLIEPFFLCDARSFSSWIVFFLLFLSLLNELGKEKKKNILIPYLSLLWVLLWKSFGRFLIYSSGKITEKKHWKVIKRVNPCTVSSEVQAIFFFLFAHVYVGFLK